EEVPSYSTAFQGPMGETINQAVQMALRGFLTLVERPRGTGPGTPHRATLDGAYALGRGEARSGRSMDALLAAYRVGARVSCRGCARRLGAAHDPDRRAPPAGPGAQPRRRGRPAFAPARRGGGRRRRARRGPGAVSAPRPGRRGAGAPLEAGGVVVPAGSSHQG